MKIVETLKEFFNQEITIIPENEVVKKALARYCEKCERGFKNQQARDAHNRIVHEGVLRKGRNENSSHS